MVPSYRTQAIVEYEKPPVNVFAYYIAKNDGYAMCCPICGKRYTYWYGDTNGGQDCYPTKRVIVKGFWFWRKRCPLSGIHKHFKCRECDAIGISMGKDAPESKLVGIE
jgi:hypothetical protein